MNMASTPEERRDGVRGRAVRDWGLCELSPRGGAHSA